MGQTQSDRIDEELTNVLYEMEQSHIRKLQGKSYRCSAKCCQGPYSTPDVVNECVKECTKPVEDSYNYVMSEIENVRNNMNKCFLDCETSLLDLNAKYENLDRSTKKVFNSCVVKCVDDNLDSIPSMMDTMKKVLESGTIPQVDKK